jgi:hypothetical protein
MIGFTLTFAEVPENLVVSEDIRQKYERIVPGAAIFGVVMPDAQVYLHEPICETYGSIADAQEHFPDALVEVSGPVVPTAYMRLRLEQDYQRQQQRNQQEYENALSMLAECDAMAGQYWSEKSV